MILNALLRVISACLCITICPINTYATQSDLTFEHVLSTENTRHLPLGTITHMTQDNLGLMWLAGRSGIFRYDGVELKSYNIDLNAPCSTLISGLTADKKGVVWASSYTGVCYYDPTKDAFIRYNFTNIQDSGDPVTRATSIAVASDNRLLIGLRGYLITVSADRSQQTIHKPEPADLKNLEPDEFRILYPDNGQVWIGTTKNGLMKYDELTEHFTHYTHQPGNVKSIGGDNVQSINKDSSGRLWLGTRGSGLNLMDNNKTTFTRYTGSQPNHPSIGNNIWSIISDSTGKMWLGTNGAGLALLDQDSGHFSHSTHRLGQSQSLSSNKVIAIFEDREQNLWLSLYPEGIELYNRKMEKVQQHLHSNNDKTTISNNGILDITESANGDIWVGTEKGLNQYNTNTNSFTNFSSNNTSKWRIPASPVTQVQEDTDGKLWLGTWGDGLYYVDPSNNQVTHYIPKNNSPSQASQSINSDIIWDILPTPKHVYIATQGGGLNVYHRESQSFSQYMHNPENPKTLSSNLLTKLAQDHDGNIWIAGRGGLDKFDLRTSEFIHYSDINTNVDTTINSDIIRALFIDQSNQLWIGSEDKGLFIYNPSSHRFKHIKQSQGLSTNNVTAIQQDPAGDMWIFTSNGLTKLNPHTFKTEIFGTSHGLVNTNINRGAGYIDSNGKVYVGSAVGLSIFEYDKMEHSYSNFPIVITSLKLANKEASFGTGGAPIKQAILKAEQVIVNHQYPMFSLSFSALTYPQSHWNKYAYFLDGFDNDWNHIGTSNSATYTNIPAGVYTFMVRAKNSDGVWSDDIKTLGITVLPPPWKTWQAYIVYISLLSLIILAFTRAKTKKIELNQQKSLNAELVRLNEIKDAFLANTSHELRTPLNGIMGLAGGLKNFTGTTQEYDKRLSLIISSSKRLSALVNDILDYSKMADSVLELHKSYVHMPTLVDEVFTILDPLAHDKKIKLLNNVSDQADIFYADENRILQILINLVSNGIKYSNGGFVSVSTEIASSQFIIKVKDSGIGIAKELHESIFQPFKQIEGSGKHTAGGTGLGLTLSKTLAELHDGKINLTSEDNKGSSFIVAIPLDRQPTVKLNDNDNTLKSGSPKNNDTEKKTILIADDDPVSRMILQETLHADGYNVVEVINGQQAINACMTNRSINFAILDVVMPRLDGYQACKEIRKTYSPKQLPIIFLTGNITAKDKDICQGLTAQDILLKPTPKDQLLQTIRAHLPSS